MQENSTKLLGRYEQLRAYEFGYHIISMKVLPQHEIGSLLYALCADVDGLCEPRTIENITHAHELEPRRAEDLEPGLAGLVRRNVLSKIGEAYFFNSLECWSIPSLA